MLKSFTINLIKFKTKMYKIFKAIDKYIVKTNKKNESIDLNENLEKNSTLIRQIRASSTPIITNTQSTSSQLYLNNNKKKFNIYLQRILNCPRTLINYKSNKLKEKYLQNEYYSNFDYEKHALSHELLVKYNNLLTKNMFNPYVYHQQINKQHQQHQFNTIDQTKYTYDNYTFVPSPTIIAATTTTSKQQQHHYELISNDDLNNIDKSIFSNTNCVNTSAYSVTYLNNRNYNNNAFDKHKLSYRYDLNTNDCNNNLSSLQLDLKIKEYLFKLKLLYPKSVYYTQILMIESVYNIKYSNLRKSFDESLQQFEEIYENQEHIMNKICKKRKNNHIDVDDNNNNNERQGINKRRSKSITNNFARSLCACSKRKKKYSNDTDLFNNNNLTITLPHLSSVSLQNLNDVIKHKNYFKLERENIEIKYENMICKLQNEILNTIKQLQQQIKYEEKLMEYENTRKDLQKKYKLAYKKQQQQQHEHSNNNHYNNQRVQQQAKIIANATPINTHECSIERKIRKRKAFERIQTNDEQLNAIRFYRNINVRETSV